MKLWQLCVPLELSVTTSTLFSKCDNAASVRKHRLVYLLGALTIDQ